jgi:hypothetical protein
VSGTPPQADGVVRWRPVLPTSVVVIAIVIAVGAMTGLILLLYRETRGPGEILRQFAQTVDGGDCSGSYELLDDSVQAAVSEEAWCDRLPQVDGQLDADFTVEQAVLEGDVAVVHIEDAPTESWTLQRFGQRSWRVVGPGEGESFAER